MLFAIGLVVEFTIGGLSGVTHAVSPVRHPADRHLLHRRPLPLRALRRRRPRLLRRLLLLVAEGLRPHAQRDARQVELLADAHRLQPHVRADAHPRPAGHAPPHLHLRATGYGLRLLEPGRARSARSSSPSACCCSSSTSSTAGARPRPTGRPGRRPVGRPQPRVDDHQPAAGAQLRRRSRPCTRSTSSGTASTTRTRTTGELAPGRHRRGDPGRAGGARRRSTSTCRRRRTGRSCWRFGLPLIGLRR